MRISLVEETRQHESIALASDWTVGSPHNVLLAMKCTPAAPYEPGTSSWTLMLWDHPLLTVLWLLIQYIRRHPPYLQVSVRNLRTRHAVVTVTHVIRSLKNRVKRQDFAVSRWWWWSWGIDCRTFSTFRRRLMAPSSEPVLSNPILRLHMRWTPKHQVPPKRP